MSAIVYGQEIPELPEAEVVLGVVVIIKTLDSEGDQTVTLRHSDDVTLVDRIGMLTMALDRAREIAREGWESEGEDEDD